ncbi:uncharacterized protein LOC8266748 isoform X2 [Ricinus communis]|uniref:uncharacterized protein LOC8266748 isoform X2 n=1 Tax=Ricinus communis TaxID=3988 RepID=UPI000772D043|nr:uncharacterized protein LOC8266748 isoform X2 [Ricinus communis]|eukprot:XP_015583221.1 uncharacterized protein LOC8266748 isoform X2 [Ricinus communis]
MMLEVMDSVDVCPTEDALSTLLEYLVDPKLPSKSAARITPTQFDQELVGKQVHAVVLLYNYYYRKQHPHLEYLGFENFCKLAVILRPTLLAHLKLMQLSNDTELDNLEEEVSLTEKMIMDACDISTTLDASRQAPTIEGWPISKVAVFLIDLKKENCLLKFGSITKGVWSVIEKDMDLSNKSSRGTIDPEHVTKKKRFIRKPLNNVSVADEADLQQLAFSAVKEVTGINQNDLLILERHDVYSTSKEKAAACFYIMQYAQSNNNNITKTPIEDALNSLQGPLFVRSSSRWIHTSVVEYFHLLPYAGILSDWLARKSSSLQVQNPGSETINVNSSKRIERPCIPEAPKSSHDGDLGSKKGSGSAKQREDDGFYAVDLTDDIDGPRKMEVDDSFVAHAETKDKVTNVVSKVKPQNCQKKTSLDGSSNGSVDKRQKISRDEPAASRNKDLKGTSSDQDGIPRNGHAIVKDRSNSNDLDKLRTVIASKDQELSQAALQVVLSKRAKLCLQLRDIEDQIAQCDKNIQTILNGGEGDLALKIESLLEGCNDVSLISLVKETQHCKEDQPSTPLIKSTRLPANIPNKQNPCQELDDLCRQKNWILPTYQVSAPDGGFQANVIVKGKDCEYSTGGGDLHPHPHEARESAALQMLSELHKAEIVQ